MLPDSAAFVESGSKVIGSGNRNMWAARRWELDPSTRPGHSDESTASWRTEGRVQVLRAGNLPPRGTAPTVITPRRSVSKSCDTPLNPERAEWAPHARPFLQW